MNVPHILLKLVVIMNIFINIKHEKSFLKNILTRIVLNYFSNYNEGESINIYG